MTFKKDDRVRWIGRESGSYYPGRTGSIRVEWYSTKKSAGLLGYYVSWDDEPHRTELGSRCYTADLELIPPTPKLTELLDEAKGHLLEEERSARAEEVLWSRARVLREAEKLITGDRNETYGSPTTNFQNTADLWSVQLSHKLKEGERFTAVDVALLMVHLKLARMIAQPKRDNFVDGAGYLACAWECQEEELSGD